MSSKEIKRAVFLDPNLQIIFLITLASVMGVSSLTPAFPKMIDTFNIPPQNIGLLITVFTLPGIFLTPVYGVLADRLGRKKVLVPSMMLFGIAGGLCWFARDFNLLLILRFLQGMGAASLLFLNITLIGDIFSGRARAAAMGYNASILSVATAGYPAVGGALATLGWNYPFVLPLIAVPIGLVALFFLESPVPEKKHELREHFKNAWESLNNRLVAAYLIAVVVSYLVLFGSYLNYIPLLMGQRFEASPLVIGIVISSGSLSIGLSSSQLGRLTKTYSERSLVMGGFAISILALAIIPLLPDLWLLPIPILMYGAAHGITIPSIQTIFAGFAPIKHRAAFMSVYGTAHRFGQTIGPIITGAVFVLGGIDGTFYIGALLSAAVLLSSFFIMKQKS